MSVGEVLDVDVITNGSPVGGGVVGAEHLHRWCKAQGCLHHHWDQVGALRPVLTDGVVEAGPGRVEVAEADGAQAGRRAVPTQDALHHRLRFGIDALGVDGS